MATPIAGGRSVQFAASNRSIDSEEITLDFENSERRLAPPAPVVSATSAGGDGGGDDGGDDDDDSSSPSPTKSALRATTKFSAATQLRSNLTREQLNKDPLFYYEVISVLGVGSMGSVAKVRKRDSVKGGSARKNLQQYFKRDKWEKECFSIPLVGGIFQYCIKNVLKQSASDRHISNSTSASEHSGGYWHSSSGVSESGSRSSSILEPHANMVENYNAPKTGYPMSPNAEDDEDQAVDEIVFAMKSIHLSRVTDTTFVEELKNELDILRQLDHPHIIRAIELFEHRNQMFIVMELCTGGDLYSRDPYTEDEAARLCSGILSAISYMHSKNITHRDLKYENILFVDSSPKAEVKLIDFGLSARFSHDDMTEGVGTIYTMAPEVLKGKYTKQADLWSVGVVTFMLLSSQMPFYGRKRKHIVEQIMKGKYEFRGRRWKRISNQAKAFVEDLLVVDPDDRATADEAFQATWLNRRFGATVRNPHAEEVVSANRSLMNYAKYSKLKKVALMIVAHKSSSQQIGILRKVFQKYDTEKNGHLSYDEFRAALADAGYADEEQYKQIFDAVDLDGSGKIRYTEFLASTIEANGAISEERLAEAFDRLDSDDSGYITPSNLCGILGEDFPTEEIDAIIKEADLTKDGKISYAEFLALWEDKNEHDQSEAMQDLRILQASDTGSSVSDMNTSTGDDVVVSRANFFEEKRKALTSSMTKEEKHVGFQEGVVAIPDVVVVDGDNKISKTHNGANPHGETAIPLKEPAPVYQAKDV